ncbi:MAG TPA: hypothetical protein VL155_15470 [Terriglobales bacterium]|jgi:hypothetical protein|nr:hypothetical protein [Terriglobales bacterium]
MTAEEARGILQAARERLTANAESAHAAIDAHHELIIATLDEWVSDPEKLDRLVSSPELEADLFKLLGVIIPNGTVQ